MYCIPDSLQEGGRETRLQAGDRIRCLEGRFSVVRDGKPLSCIVRKSSLPQEDWRPTNEAFKAPKVVAWKLVQEFGPKNANLADAPDESAWIVS